MIKLMKFFEVKPGTLFRYNSMNYIKTELASSGAITYNARTINDSFGNHVMEFVEDRKLVKVQDELS